MWIQSLFYTLLIISLFIISNMGFISIDLTTKEILTLWSSNKHTLDELSFLICSTNYLMLTNNSLFLFCITIFLLRNKLKESLYMILSVILISVINNAITLIYILNFSTSYRFIKDQSLNWILISFPISMVIIYLITRIELHKK
ncbi:hypothetical protein Xekj_02036 [Xenorhabdus sp. KJ12.1]|nr:hypothetical protein Xekj_02036 [Xenorhabdus sp. KJ12.1]